MATTNNSNASTKVVTGIVRFSYVHVFAPRAMEGSEPKYSVSLLIPKEDKETLAKIKRAIDLAKEQGLPKWGGKAPANLRSPVRDGDTERPDDPAYAGHFFINATCKTKPGVVDRNLQPILDSTELYSGCYGRASITFYAYSVNGNRGIACGLNNIQKLRDGESLGGRARAEDEFNDGFGAEAFRDDDEDMSFL